MARAAVKAKQLERAQAAKATAKPARKRGRRGHASGGNPNQDLFFVKLRRHQKWVYMVLAVVFAVSFVFVGVGSGSGGLSDLYTGLFGGSSGQVAKAQGEIKKDPVKGYRDLATAYETKGDLPDAITALQSYLKLKPKDASVWTELAGFQLSQAQTYSSQYQTAQQNAQLSDPASAFAPTTGKLASAFSNPADTYNSELAQSQLSQLGQQAQTAEQGALSAYKKVEKLQPKNAQVHAELANVAEQTGDYATALKEYKTYLKLYPSSPNKAQITSVIKELQKALAPAKSSGK